MSPPYLSTLEVLDSSRAVAPALLDSLSFEYRGISVHLYGTLHALTGGTNQAYVAAVDRTIAQARGLRLGEQGMQAMYKGLDAELQDWVQIPPKDALRLAANLIFPPHRLISLIASIAREKLTVADRFGAGGVRRLQDIGGAMAFHLLNPAERRRMAGFPDAPTYLVENLRRRRGESRLCAPSFPDPDWHWLRHIEPFANIPCRSVHMLEFAVEFARLKGSPEVSLFVGEVHNSDMHWYHQQLDAAAESSLPDWVQAELRIVRDLARAIAALKHQGASTGRRRAAYLSAIAVGLGLPIAAYGLAAFLLLAR